MDSLKQQPEDRTDNFGIAFALPGFASETPSLLWVTGCLDVISSHAERANHETTT
ncbi:hypothetical protein RB10931 [Rhodopirellula baltica SH 1]|uniref:Uncharacterized protein n=1 Tax=Rhodopirellula baltica (strain DSM 10527 / NCIMB 13988 / SH1) TaxID=243090 RepID=Q7UK10_RHOBA|nr:hypothetical protein RB10931 [Rhodopirellula baltica SH 1]